MLPAFLAVGTLQESFTLICCRLMRQTTGGGVGQQRHLNETTKPLGSSCYTYPNEDYSIMRPIYFKNILQMYDT